MHLINPLKQELVQYRLVRHKDKLQQGFSDYLLS